MCDSDFGSDFSSDSDMDFCDVDVSFDVDSSDVDMDFSDTLDLDIDSFDISEPMDLDVDALDIEDSMELDDFSDVDYSSEDILDLNDSPYTEEFEEPDLIDVDESGLLEDDFEMDISDSYDELSEDSYDLSLTDVEDTLEEFEESSDLVNQDTYEDWQIDESEILERDPDELFDAGMRNVEDILDVRRDDMLDKGMSESEIEEALNIERVELQDEFLQDAFSGYDLSMEELEQEAQILDDSEILELEDISDEETGDVKILERDPDELFDAGMRNVEDILDMRRDDMLDKGMSENEIESAINAERVELQNEFLQDAFSYRNDSDISDEVFEPDDITEDERTQIIRDVVDQNVTSSVLPKSGGYWLDESVPGDTKWILDDDTEISWRKAGEKYSLSGKELKEKYQIDGVDYHGKEPDFTPFEDDVIGHVELEHFSDQRIGKNGTYSNATKAAAETLGWQPADVDRYMEENGLTWHECGDRKTVRAIPTEINAAFKHTGGIGIEKSMEAMSDELNERYGGLKLVRNSYSGSAYGDELKEAIENIQDNYRTRKRGR